MTHSNDEITDKIDQYKALFEAFPNFPAKMMNCLILKSKGNCREVFLHLRSKGWKPIKYTKKSFSDSFDKHFTISYFHGIYSPNIYEEIVAAPAGTYLTCYKLTPSRIRYYCINKDKNSFITEQVIDNCEVQPTIQF